MNNGWRNPENWNNNTLVYYEKSDVLYFDSTAEYETAVYAVSVPEWASSFSLSFKAGNSDSPAKAGAKDAGYMTVSTASGVIAKTPMIQVRSSSAYRRSLPKRRSGRSAEAGRTSLSGGRKSPE